MIASATTNAPVKAVRPAVTSQPLQPAWRHAEEAAAGDDGGTLGLPESADIEEQLAALLQGRCEIGMGGGL